MDKPVGSLAAPSRGPRLTPLRVALDVSAVPASPVGAGQYILELARALSARKDVELTVLARRHDGDRWSATMAAGRVHRVAPDPMALRLAWGETWLSAAVGRMPGGRPDVLHGPHYTLPIGLGVPGVVTVHDLTLVEHPEWHERSKAAYFSWALRAAARRADGVVCPSERTAERFVARFAPRGTVHVVPHGVDHLRFRPPDGENAATDAATIGRLGLAGADYVLHLGTLEPRKDVATLVRAFDRVAGSHPELLLVLAGRDGWGRQSLDQEIRSARHSGRIRRLGYVDDAAAASLLRGAAVVAYPSLEEGFGLPALEALACGTALVTTGPTAMSEIAGDAAIVVARADPARLADALEAAFEGGTTATWRRRRGIERAASYSWEASATGHVRAYREAAGL